MRAVAQIIDIIIKHEGMRLKPYLCSAGKQTIGVGRNIEDNGITDREAIYLLTNDIYKVESELRTFHWFEGLTSNRKVALIDMCFNLGLHRFKTFKKMIKAIEDQKYDRAADEMMDSKWAKQVGSRADDLSQMMRS